MRFQAQPCHHARHPRRAGHPCAKVTPRVLQVLRNDGHVVECGGVPPLWRKTRGSSRAQLSRRSKSGGAPPRSTTQAKLRAANEVPCNTLKSATNSSRNPVPKITLCVFRFLVDDKPDLPPRITSSREGPVAEARVVSHRPAWGNRGNHPVRARARSAICPQFSGADDKHRAWSKPLRGASR